MNDASAAKVLLVVHHTASPATQELLEAALAGTRAEGIEGVEVVVRPALAATASDVLASDGFLLGTPANIGYMSGALKVFFDQVYYPTLTAKVAAPYGLYVHGNNDAAGAVRAVEAITKGMGWERVHEPVTVIGAVDKESTEAVWELAATVAARLAGIA
jgi:multimeric flavodoxin WrbA